MADREYARLRPERTMSFVDAVLAIILTILVLGLEVPENHDFTAATLRSFLQGVFEDLHPYLATFIVVGAFWVEHTVVSHYVTRGSRTYEWLSLLFLLPLSILPFLTKLRAQYPSEPTTEILFGGALALSFLIFAGLWRYAISRELVPPDRDPKALSIITRRLVLAAVLSVVGAGIATVNTVAGTVVFLCIPFLFLSNRYVDANWDPDVAPEGGQDA